MKVTLDKKIDLQTATVYLRFKKEVARKDIQDYLGGKHFDDPLVEIRVRDYLKSIGIFDEKYQLTSLGYAVKESGMMPTPEEGKYKVWFTNGDSQFGHKILYFKRIQPNRDNRNENRLDMELGKDHFYLPTQENDFAKMELLPIDGFFGQKHDHASEISVRWTWDKLEKSTYEFNGELDKGKDKGKYAIKLKTSPVPCDLDLNDWVRKLLPDWDDDEQKLRFPFNQLSDSSKESFELNDQRTWSDFNADLQKIPLMPYGLEDAKAWRDWLVMQELRKDYLNHHEFENELGKANERKAFKPFTESLDHPSLASFSKSTEDDASAFWHLHAPFDLNPNAQVKLPAKPFALKKGTKLSFNELVGRLDLGELEDGSTLVYYDQYVINYYQQRTVAALAKAVACDKTIVVTKLSHSNSNDFLRKNHPEIKLKDLGSVFDGKPEHDRYIILGSSSGIQVWNISQSTDYIRFDGQIVNPDSQGTIQNTVVFTPLSEKMIDKALLKILKLEMNNER